jgi:hypothetical protein
MSLANLTSRLADRARPALPAAIAVCLLLAVAACSARPAVIAAQRKHVRPVPAVSKLAISGSDRLSRGETRALAARYLAIARPANRRLDVENDSYADDDHGNLAASESDLRGEVATEQWFDQRLLKIDFPASIATVAWELVQLNSQRIYLTEEQALAGSTAGLLAFNSRHRAADAAVEVQVRLIREDLGLPPPDNS